MLINSTTAYMYHLHILFWTMKGQNDAWEGKSLPRVSIFSTKVRAALMEENAKVVDVLNDVFPQIKTFVASKLPTVRTTQQPSMPVSVTSTQDLALANGDAPGSSEPPHFPVSSPSLPPDLPLSSNGHAEHGAAHTNGDGIIEPDHLEQTAGEPRAEVGANGDTSVVP